MSVVEELLVADPEYGEEISLEIAPTGRMIRTNAGKVGEAIVGADYIRVVDRDGAEIAYWTHEEWVEDPVVVLGAIIAIAAGD